MNADIPRNHKYIVVISDLIIYTYQIIPFSFPTIFHMFGEDATIFFDHFCRGNIISKARQEEFLQSDLFSF